MATAIAMSADVQSVMEERGIQQDDLRQAVESCGEATHLRSADGRRILAKKRIGNFTVYAEFTRAGDDVDIHNVYSHRVGLREDQA